jgi:tripartite-type tricarboxylate transporter receptor subunit TctC
MHPIVRSAAALLLALGLASPLAAQTNWPEKPVKLVVGFTAGSATDVTARIFAQKFSEAWGQPVIVENIAGNSGAIGVDRVAKAPPDGYTLMWSGNAAITIPASRRCPSIPSAISRRSRPPCRCLPSSWSTTTCPSSRWPT